MPQYCWAFQNGKGAALEEADPEQVFAGIKKADRSRSTKISRQSKTQ